ncbi:MAG: hypothetical protein A2X08_10505 [Bacteroidetes bacterium GWA2_32_17]|nr:MAG: hypothetical protein A2X08_10505 [Bacteroidetes bacterium GWA2_32_17]
MVTVLFQILGILIVIFLFWLIRKLMAPGKSFNDFFIGDNGTYSLSRLQMVGWAVLIISMQVSAILLLLFNKKVQCSISAYNFVLPEEMLFLLGISLAGYVVVKGITIDRISKNKVLPKSKTTRIADVICSENGLDFSKFQMLIWTVIAMFMYMVKCNFYFDKIIFADSLTALNNLFVITDNNINGVPNIDMSFIILMGISHGAYIGKKLVPSFKSEEMSKKLQEKNTDEIISLKIGIQFRESELKLYQNSPQYDAKKYQEMNIEIEKAKQNLKDKEDYLEKLKKE